MKWLLQVQTWWDSQKAQFQGIIHGQSWTVLTDSRMLWMAKKLCNSIKHRDNHGSTSTLLWMKSSLHILQPSKYHKTHTHNGQGLSVVFPSGKVLNRSARDHTVQVWKHRGEENGDPNTLQHTQEATHPWRTTRVPRKCVGIVCDGIDLVNILQCALIWDTTTARDKSTDERQDYAQHLQCCFHSLKTVLWEHWYHSIENKALRHLHPHTNLQNETHT